MWSSVSSHSICFVALFCVIVIGQFDEETDPAIHFEQQHPHVVRNVDSRLTSSERSCFGEGATGKCVEITSCPPAMREVRLHKKHNFKRCGFRGIIEIICCPNEYIIDMTTKLISTWVTNTTQSPTTDKHDSNATEKTVIRLNNRKSAQVCDEYTNEIKADTKPDVSFHIIEGEDAGLKEFPHMVALGYNTDTIGETKWGCGGSLISPNFVLTAAHCIITADQNPPVRARAGVIKLDDANGNVKPQDFDILNITIHPDYKKWDKLNDIALIKLNRNADYTDYVHPACLYDAEDDPQSLIVTGWGDTEIAGDGSNILQKAKLMPVALRECNITYLTRVNKNVMRTHICAADNKSDTCQGDSGGPLQVPKIVNSNVYSIVGVTSYGIGCGSKYPGVYTRVSSYLDWIESIVWRDT